MNKKLKIGYVKLESCNGCIQSILTHRDIVDITNYIEFHEALTNKDNDLILIEGAAVTTEQIKILNQVLSLNKKIILIGSCSFSPESILGVKDIKENYPHYNTIKIPGCPPSRNEIIHFLKDIILNKGLILKSQDLNYPLCKDCQDNEIICLKTKGIECDGESTIGNCEVLCPKIGKSCTGCRTKIKGV